MLRIRKGKGCLHQKLLMLLVIWKTHCSWLSLKHLGTNRNEQFHSHIKTFFHKRIFLAYALLTVIIYSYNCALTIKDERVIRPIAASVYRSMSPTNLPPIGILPKEHLQYQQPEGSEHWGYWCDWLPNGHGTGMVNLHHIVTENANQ